MEEANAGAGVRGVGRFKVCCYNLVVWAVYPASSRSTRAASAVGAAPLDQCVSGTYKAVMDIRIVFPPGYEPNPQAGTVTTANTWYDC